MQAIIFDCDGTLADTMPIHFEAWDAVLTRHGFSLTEDRFYSLGGWPTDKIVQLLADEQMRVVDVLAIVDEKEAEYQQRMAHVTPIEAVVTVVQAHRGKLPMAVATGSMRTICEATLRHVGLWGIFDTVVSCEDVTRHKPEPDVFLEAARRLNVAPEHCRVYEDTDPGVEAARRAGMECVDVRSFYVPRRITAR